MRTVMFRHSAIAVVVSLGVFGGFGSAYAQNNGVTASEIKIGAIGALTGPLAFIGAPGRDSITMAFDEINAKGGVCGRKLSLDFQGAATARRESCRGQKACRG